MCTSMCIYRHGTRFQPVLQCAAALNGAAALQSHRAQKDQLINFSFRCLASTPGQSLQVNLAAKAQVQVFEYSNVTEC